MRPIDSQFIKRRDNEINYDIYINYFCFNSRTRDEKKPEKDSKFLDIKVDNPELQEEIYNLKKQYDSELNELKVQFKEKKKSLKKSYKGQLKEIRKSYKKQKVKKKNKKN